MFTKKAVLLIMAATLSISIAKSQRGTITTLPLHSTILHENLVGVNTTRAVTVYLPASYQSSNKHYPVLYYLHSVFMQPADILRESNMPGLLYTAFAAGASKEFILVVPDCSSTMAGTFYENSPVSGRWLDFIAQELVPFIDTSFRTIASRDSRVVAGNYMGGRGALAVAMRDAKQFSVAYALHPVATGNGYVPWAAFNGDWKKVAALKSLDDARAQGQAFIVGLCQAFLPNPGKAPLYCDYFMDIAGGQPTLDPALTAKAQHGFLLDRQLEEYAANLRTLRGLALDWARYDPNQDHVYSARAFAYKLEDLGVNAEGEEYSGNPSNKNWGTSGPLLHQAPAVYGKIPSVC